MAKRRLKLAPPAKPTDPVSRYARVVLAGKILAGRAVRLACERHVRDYARQRTKAFPYYFSPKAAKHIIDFFPAFIRLEDGVTPMVLAPWQAFCLGSCFGWRRVADDGRRFQRAYISTGKGPLALDTPIPTPSGWVRMGDVVVGDRVFDETGNPCTVMETSPVFLGRPCYRLRFSDGTEIVADAEHRWRTASLRSGAPDGTRPKDWPRNWPRKGGYGVRTTAYISKTVRIPESTSRHPQAKWNYRIDVADALELPHVDLPVPPYVLGVWLGDGDSDCARVTIGDQDVAELTGYIRSDGVELVKQSTSNGRTSRYRLNGGSPTVQARLRELGVLGDKHIPLSYLRGSKAQRLALAQGLMDTDGSALKGGAVEFSVCRRRLAEDVVALLRTLGYKPTMLGSDAVLNGRVVGLRWRVRVHCYQGASLFRLKRKSARLSKTPKTRPLSRGRMIVACEPVESTPVRCITVDSPSHLFLAGEGLIPTHNSGKTPALAAVGLYCLAFDNEQANEVYSAAFDKGQASILVNDAIRMATDSPDLAALFDIGKYNVAHVGSGSFFRAVSSEHRSKSGPRPGCVLIDEVHEHRDGRVINKMLAGFKSRVQPILIEITNTGSDKTSICWQHNEHSLSVLEGTLTDEQWFAYVCQLDPCAKCYADGYREPKEGCLDCDDWTDEKVWPKTNPSLCIGLPRRSYLQSQVDSALAMPSDQALVKRLNFCIWTATHTVWIAPDRWAACRVPMVGDCLDGARAAAFDMSEKLDLTACVIGIKVAAPADEPIETIDITDIEGEETIHKSFDMNFYVDLIPYFWLPEETLRERVSKERIPFDVWARDGHLRVTPGPVIDYDQIYEEFTKDIGKRFSPQRIGYDPHNATQFALQLRDKAKFTVVEIAQGRKLSESFKLFEALVRLRRIRHQGNPILSWCVANAERKHDRYENCWVEKPSQVKRIDGLIASVMVLNQLMLLPFKETRRKRGARIWTPAGFVPALPVSSGGSDATA